MSSPFEAGVWLNPPGRFAIEDAAVTMTTDPGTDWWQRTFYGFRNDNAHALLLESDANFTFTARATFSYRTLFDQCGLAVYLDSENWVKASVEHENDDFARLGAVVTNLGYSDWATTDIVPLQAMWFRLSRRGPDFLLESSPDGSNFEQMRIFHLHALGPTTEEMGAANPPLPATQSIRFGLYACSPLESSFEARFDQIQIEACQWQAHSVGDG